MISGQEAANSQQRVNYVPAACFTNLYFGVNRYIVALTEVVGVLCRDHRLLLDMPTQGRLGEATGSIIPARTQRAGIFPLFCKQHPWLTVTASLSVYQTDAGSYKSSPESGKAGVAELQSRRQSKHLPHPASSSLWSHRRAGPPVFTSPFLSKPHPLMHTDLGSPRLCCRTL